MWREDGAGFDHTSLSPGSCPGTERLRERMLGKEGKAGSGLPGRPHMVIFKKSIIPANSLVTPFSQTTHGGPEP